MRLTSFEAIAEALERAAVRYLVAGGLAVNAHGYLHFTKDVDLVIQLQTDNLRRALAAREALGYRPAIPVSLIRMKAIANRPQDQIDIEHLRMRMEDHE